MTDEPAGQPGAVPRAEADIGNSGPAVYSNKFMTVLGPVVKIIFMEQGGPTEPLFFRSAVVLNHQDAIALKNLLTTMLADVERQIEAAMQAQKPSSNV